MTDSLIIGIGHCYLLVHFRLFGVVLRRLCCFTKGEVAGFWNFVSDVNANIMAHQDSFIKLKGRIGDLTFYKTKGGYLAREKGGIDGNRIATDPRFQRTRENGAEFGRAGSAAKLLRDSLTSIISSGKDSAMSNRLTKLMLKVVQADAVNDRGLRMVLDAETEMLKGFEFNANAQINSVLAVSFDTSIDRVTGGLKVELPEFDPKVFLKAPQGATHFQFKAMGLALNFTTGAKELNLQVGALLPLNEVSAALSMVCDVAANATDPLFLVFGVEFFQMVNTKTYPLNNGAHNGVRIVNVLGT